MIWWHLLTFVAGWYAGAICVHTYWSRWKPGRLTPQEKKVLSKVISNRRTSIPSSDDKDIAILYARGLVEPDGKDGGDAMWKPTEGAEVFLLKK